MRRLLRGYFALLALVTAALAHTREVYVWQRQFDAEVAAALSSFQPQIDGACVLVAEVGWKAGKFDVVRPSVDFRTLATMAKPVGIAVRIGAYSGKFAEDDASVAALVGLVRERLATAMKNGLKVAELQIDFDCAESKLAGYRSWVRTLRQAAAPAPLVFTALPAWLRHPDFVPLARSADGFILQVHSLERPPGPQADFTLCDPVRAMVWAGQANKVGVPFRIALPTYGYVVAFDAAGKFLGVGAEGLRPNWPGDAQLRTVRADATAMARLAREIKEANLSQCRGEIWFRLPVPRDRMNWDAVTFATVLRGERPIASLIAEVERPEPGLVEIVVTNRGQTTEPLPPSVTLKWKNDARVLAADGIGGFRLEIFGGQAQGIARAANVPVDAIVAPGGKARIAWLRFAHEVSVEVSLPAAP